MAGMQRTSPIPEIGVLNNGNPLTFEILLKPPVLSMENVKKVFVFETKNLFTRYKQFFYHFQRNFFDWWKVVFEFFVASSDNPIYRKARTSAGDATISRYLMIFENPGYS